MNINIKIKTNNKILKIPNCDEFGNIQEGYWDKEYAEQYFKSTFISILKNYLNSEEFKTDYEYDLCFESDDIFDDFDIEIEVEDSELCEQ